MVQIICLANSKKYGDRCIAGIENSTGKWIRPVTNLEHGQVPKEMCLVDNEEPRLLDILEIPLLDTCPGYEYENRLIVHGKWQRVGQASIADILQYCEAEILHSQWQTSVPISFLESLLEHQRRTLQLMRTTKFQVDYCEGTRKWEASILTANAQTIRAKITDLALIDKLNQGTTIGNECLVTISLGQPWRKTDLDEFACWKLIAGVIELSKSDLIWMEMQRLGWSLAQGRSYLHQTYNKRSRQELTSTEITEFLNYLKSLPTPFNITV
ncbi:hypothetical protein ACF3DV_28700 [Chlorogloeopsis fritschii PCC 9212]|uniref:Dual OB-containing domain-containing protein n=1 Tax=Chlorogloeopsis fritschii PCC 6912 TaxID=211165 RepID=A0A3S0ZGL4_CHLFR|nr:hypothetical protein [Chlorogloeopsis fritschii]RUR75786.1 hypothetical protein PCC6912_46830 [Chlorogloeopsis fritschii PCC 6912]